MRFYRGGTGERRRKARGRKQGEGRRRGIGRIREGDGAISRHMTYYNLRDAMAKPGCPICKLVSDAVARYLETFL